MKTKLPVFAGVLALCGMLTAGHAASVTWNSGIIGSSGNDGDVITAVGGTVIDAYYFGSPSGTLSLNGVSFTNVNWQDWFQGNVAMPFPNSNGSLLVSEYNNYHVGQTAIPAWGSLSANYQALLGGAAMGSASYNGSTAAPLTLTLSNLNVGDTYQAEIWVASTNITGDEYITFGGVATPFHVTSITSGEYVTATFMATSDTQTLSIDATAPAQSILNAFDLIDTTAVPEPSTVALLSVACGLMGFVAVRRFRLAAV